MSQQPPQGTGRATAPAAASLPATMVPSGIVPLDGSAHALAALPVARVIADLQGATLRIVHVAEPAMPPQVLLDRLGLTTDQFRGSVLEQASGPPAARIVGVAGQRQRTMIVMCVHTGMGKTGGDLGSVAEAVLRGAPCPVVLVRPERGLEPWALRTMLLPHDGTPTTAAANHSTFQLAEQAGAELIVLHIAAGQDRPPVEPGTFGASRYMDQPQHEWSAWTDEFLERLCCLGDAPATIRIRLLVAHGEPDIEIVRVAREHASDLIVLAWRGRFEAQRAATLKAVIRDAPCPVLVLRAEEG